MKDKMKILVAYDGSACADAALADLQRAGLPDALEVVVLSVADVFVPPPLKEGVDDTVPFYMTPGIRRAHEQAAREVEQARTLAERACERLKSLFPHWEVRAEAYADSPVWAVIRKADEWQPELIVVGAQGHTALGGRLILGSVSQQILYEARCSVRVARTNSQTAAAPVRIIIGTDGSPDAAATIAAVAGRVWPPGSEVRIVAVLDSVMSVPPAAAELAAIEQGAGADEGEEMQQIFAAAAEKLRAAGLNTSTLIKQGNPKQLLVAEAETWHADAIFVGAKGIRGIERILLGSVSAAVAARAPCSVEVVRPTHKAA